MKILKIFIILGIILVTVCILSCKQEIHKHFILENEGFKMALIDKNTHENQSSILFKIGEKRITETEKIVETTNLNKTTEKTSDISKIIPSLYYDEKSNYYDTSTETNKTNEDIITEAAKILNEETIENINQSEQIQKIADAVRQNRKHDKREKPNASLENNASCPICDHLASDSGYRNETIAWNIWRSNIQNRIMDDSAVDAQYGTLFFFTFKVDRNRHISNIKVTSTDKSDQYSINAIHDAIYNLNGKKILDFPEGSNRRIVNFSGGFIIGTYAHYSSPSDYNDFENIRINY